MAYEYQPYPRWKFHATKDPVIVHSAEHESTLDEGWQDAPVVVDPAADTEILPQESIETIDTSEPPTKQKRRKR